MARNGFKNFIQSRAFSFDWDRLGLRDPDLQRLETLLRGNPLAGTVIQGTSGVRKLRFAKERAGKSGGYRIFYRYFPEYRVFFLALVISKHEDRNISASAKFGLKTLISEIRSLLERW